ncbi:MAG: NAD(P)/FAD-dependent oxidoreductase [Candidatus Doudnabacteria bacterium]|nr:NAD(P)/FAD-dependent oxidoreductase [Candidatus Doudnabacteria bacterium]
MSNKHIVIVGAGYGGLLSAVKLKQKFKNRKDIAITVVDKRDYQLLTFDLYEAATSEEEFVTTKQLQKSITLPVKEILDKIGVSFVQAEVKSADLRSCNLQLAGKNLAYDYLVLAAGSVADDLGVQGALDFGVPLKTFEDALRLRNRIEFAFQAHTQDMTKKNLRFVVAGGGYTGCEVAGELNKLKNILCWKYNYPPEKVEILVVEAAGALIPGFSKNLSRDAFMRLQEIGVRVMFSGRIASVSQQFVELMSGEKIAYDCLIWTVGVRARSLSVTLPVELDSKGRFKVNQFLQLRNYSNVFSVGDLAGVLQKDGRPVPQSAQDAIEQAEYLAEALPSIMENKQPKVFEPKSHGFIVTLGGRWAIMDYNGFYIKGQLAYFIRALAHMRYLSNFYGWVRAAYYVAFQVKIFGRND